MEGTSTQPHKAKAAYLRQRGEEIISQQFFETKLRYIHQNPVRAGLVEKEEEYLYSSCGDYYGIRKGKLELCVG